MSVKTENLSEIDNGLISRAEGQSFKPKPILKWIAWLVISMLALATCLALYAWLNRFALAERYVQRFFAAQDVEAKLTITSLSKTRITIDNITLSYLSDEAPFFSAKHVEADFDAKAASHELVRKLRFVEPYARITLNEAFEIIDGWVPPHNSSRGEKGVSIPSEGIFVEGARIDFQTPYGGASIGLNASVRDIDLFQGTVILSPSTLNYDAWSFNGSARIEMDVEGDKSDIKALVHIENLSGETSRGEPISVEKADLNIIGEVTSDNQLPVDLDTLDIIYQGELSGRADRIVTPPGVLKNNQFKWDGIVSRMTDLSVPLGSKGTLSISTDQFLFSDPLRGQGFAKTLTLSEALSRTPIAQHFAPSVTQAVEFLIQGASLDMEADVAFDDETGRVSLLAPMEIKRDASLLHLTGHEFRPLYEWVRANDDITVSFSKATFNRPIALTFDDTVLHARTNNGWQLQGIESFLGTVSTQSIWEEQTIHPIVSQPLYETEVARLKPFKATLNYQNNEDDRSLLIEGGIDFDGRVPGGYLTGFSTRGKVDMTLAPKGKKGLVLSYKPSDRSLLIDHIEADKDWRLSNIQFHLDKERDVFTLNENFAIVDTKLSNISFLLTHAIDKLSIGMKAERLDLLGRLRSDKVIDNWTLDFEGAHLSSASFANEELKAVSSKGCLSVSRSSNEINFDLKSPDTDILTSMGDVQGLDVVIKGVPEKFEVVHKEGLFSSDDIRLPDWPISGQAIIAENTITGTVKAIIPNAGNVPVNATYAYSRGVGEAKIQVQDLVFKPGKLQPQNLTSAFAGKLAQVDGRVSANLNLNYVTGQALETSGVLSLKDMSFGTAPGPVTDLNTQIELTSLFPIETAGSQTLTVARFDPGFPLEEGLIEYDLAPDGVIIHSAVWPMGAGAFTLDPFKWKYGADENRVTMRLNEIPINTFLENYGEGKLQMTGTVRGKFPIVVKGLNVFVDNGYLQAPDGGVIRYNPNEGEAITYSQEEAVEILRRQDTPKYRSLARDALREFSYRDLSASINGPLDGDVSLAIVFDGANKKVLNGQPFEFDISVEGELFNIARSFNSNAQIKSELLRNEALSVNE